MIGKSSLLLRENVMVASVQLSWIKSLPHTVVKSLQSISGR